jgi:hypothetical protein
MLGGENECSQVKNQSTVELLLLIVAAVLSNLGIYALNLLNLSAIDRASPACLLDSIGWPPLNPVLATSEVIPSRAVRALEGEGRGLSHLEMVVRGAG